MMLKIRADEMHMPYTTSLHILVDARNSLSTYDNEMVAPNASSVFCSFSASSFGRFSLRTCGHDSTNFLACVVSVERRVGCAHKHLDPSLGRISIADCTSRSPPHSGRLASTPSDRNGDHTAESRCHTGHERPILPAGPLVFAMSSPPS